MNCGGTFSKIKIKMFFEKTIGILNQTSSFICHFFEKSGNWQKSKIGNEIDSKAVKLAVTLREYTHSDTSYLLTVKAGIARCMHFTAHSFLRQTNTQWCITCDGGLTNSWNVWQTRSPKTYCI
jgi:hypothetical protein